MGTDRTSARPYCRSLVGAARNGAVAALAGAATIHATVLGDHYAEWPVAGVFFLGLLVGETFLGLWLWRRPSRAAALAVVVSGFLTVAVWAVSRTTGMPVGPAELRQPEGVSAPDLACVVLEQLAAILAYLGTRRSTQGQETWRGATAPGRLADLVVVGVVALVTVLGLGPALGGEHHHDETSAGSHHAD